MKTKFSWNIDPLERAWFIFPDGTTLSGMSHRLLLRDFFYKEWNELAENCESESEIDKILENWLVATGVIKIGELDDFYMVLTKLGEREKEVIQGFIQSILKVRKDITNRTMIIRQEISRNREIKCGISDLLDKNKIEKM